MTMPISRFIALLVACLAGLHLAAHAEESLWTDLRILPMPGFDEGRGAVAIDGDAAVVAARLSATQIATAHYERTPAGWQYRGQTTIDRISSNPQQSVSLKGNTIALADSSRVWMLRKLDSVWVREQTISPSLNGPGESSLHVALVNEHEVAIGSPRTLVDGVLGQVLLYARDQDGVWRESRRIQNPESPCEVRFGAKIATDGQRLIVSAPLFSDAQPSQGAVYIYNLTQPAPTLEARLMHLSPRPNDRIGQTALALSGDRAVASTASPNFEDPNLIEVFAHRDGAWMRANTISAEEFDDVAGSPYTFGRELAIVGDSVFSGWIGAVVPGSAPLVQPGALLRADFEGDTIVRRQRYFVDTDEVGSALGLNVAADEQRVIVTGVPSVFRPFRPVILSRDSECFRDLRGDANNDGVTNFEDLNLVLSQYAQKGDALEGDLNNDSVVNMIDLNVVLALFGSPCIPPN
jgi:hypothetical protein